MIRRLWWTLAQGMDTYENLAREQALMLHTGPEECILYLWQNERTVVIGRNQDAFRECFLENLKEDGGHLARRLSGGGAVYHDAGNLNFSFLVRKPDYEVDRQTEVILRAVRAAGIQAERTGRNDLESDGRKFSGHAFFRSGEFCCHHGTVLLRTDRQAMERYLRPDPGKLRKRGVDSVRSRVCNLGEFLPGLTPEMMQKRMLEAFGEVYGLCAEELSESRLPEEELNRFYRRFSSAEWIYGRDIPFSRSFSGRFSWGSLRIRLLVRDHGTAEAAVDSDALDEEYIRRLAEALQNAEDSPASLEEAVRRVRTEKEDPGEQALRDVMQEDIIRLIRQEMGGNEDGSSGKG